MIIHCHKENYNQSKKHKTNRDLFLHLLNLWKALEVERKARIRMRKSQSLKWIQNACLVLGNLPEDYYNVSNLLAQHTTLQISFSEVSKSAHYLYRHRFLKKAADALQEIPSWAMQQASFDIDPVQRLQSLIKEALRRYLSFLYGVAQQLSQESWGCSLSQL